MENLATNSIALDRTRIKRPIAEGSLLLAKSRYSGTPGFLAVLQDVVDRRDKCPGIGRIN